MSDGEKILLQRRRRGQKAYTLAGAAGIAPSILSAIERGEREATFEQKLALARALGVEPETLFSRVTV